MDRLLFVDDEPFVLKALKRTFELEGFEVVTAQGPLEALDILRTAREFQVIGSDYRMPEMNGAEFLQRARELAPHSYRLLISAVEEFGVAVEAVNRGEIHRLIPKPWDRDELIQLVRSAAEEYHLRQRYQEMTALLHAKNAALELANRDLEIRVSESTAGFLVALAAALDTRRAKGVHSRLTSLRARRLGAEMGLLGGELSALEQAGLVHDIGLVTVPDEILQKSGPLTPEEWERVQRHSLEGYRILAQVPFLREARKMVLLHHERWDGSGYPFGLAGEKIPLAVRVLSLAENYSALREARSYRAARTQEDARKEIAQDSGKRFDPALVAAFLRIPQEEWEVPRELHLEVANEPDLEELKRRAFAGEL